MHKAEGLVTASSIYILPVLAALAQFNHMYTKEAIRVVIRVEWRTGRPLELQQKRQRRDWGKGIAAKSCSYSVATGHDVFAVLPTCYGKSLCYGCLPLVFDSLHKQATSIVAVVTPLTVIIEDQVALL